VRAPRFIIAYSPAELAWLSDNRTMPIGDYHAAFCSTFARDVSAQNLHALRKRKGWRTGRTGRIEKGATPPNKGKKMPYNAACAATQFKPGNRSGTALDRYKPIGTERMHESGCLQRKVHDGLPMQSRWQFVHRIEWEAVNGTIPDGMVLKCKGSKTDTAPSNWELIPVGMLPRLNGIHGRGYDAAPEELKPIIMTVARLAHRVAEKA
jgi:hypothetical protein